jgi:hypothetical protein
MPDAELRLDELAKTIRLCRRLGVPHFRHGDLEFTVDLSFQQTTRTARKAAPPVAADESDTFDDTAEPDYRVGLERQYADARATARSAK